jgi:HK97 family phage major capsid protein
MAEEITPSAEMTAIDALSARFETALDARDERIIGGFARRLDELAAPRPTFEPDPPAAEIERKTQDAPPVRCSSPTERLYRNLPEAARKIRTPDADHYMAQWLRAMAGPYVSGYGDQTYAMLRQASDWCEQNFGRADILVGTGTGTGGGIQTGTGGHLVPVPLLSLVEINIDLASKIPQMSMQVQLTNGTARIPTADQASGGMVAEGGTPAQGEPDFATIQPNARKAVVFMKASTEMIQDSAFNLVTVLSSRAGRALGAIREAQTGEDGDGLGNNIQEVLTGTAYTLDTINVLTYTDLVQMYFAVPQQYRASAAWLGAGDVLTFVSRLTNEAGGAGLGFPIFSQQSGRPGVVTDDSADGVMMRKPVYEVGTPAGQLYFGDVSQNYAFCRAEGLTAAVSTEAEFAAGLVQYRFEERYDGVNVDGVAGVQATGITSIA